MKFRPQGNRVLVKRVAVKTTTAGGLIIPDSVVAKEKPQEGQIVAVGREPEHKLREGDYVLFGKYAGTDIRVEGVEHLILDAGEVLGVIEE